MKFLRLKTNKGRSSVKTPTSKKSISPKHFFNKENVAPTRTRQTSTTPQYMPGDDLFSLHSITKYIVVDSGNDDDENGKSVSEDDEILFLPDPKTTTVLPSVNLYSSSCDVNLPKSSAVVDGMHFVDSSQAQIFDIWGVGTSH